MKKILIVGAGGSGREVLECCLTAIDSDQLDILGFLDDNLNALEKYPMSHSVVGTIADFQPNNDVELVIAIGDPVLRKKIFTDLKKRGATFATIIHKTAYLSPSAKMGEGCILMPFTALSCHTITGDGVFLNFYSNIGHDSKTGDFCVINAHANINGFCVLGECVLVGGHGVVLPWVHVGAYAKIGAGSAAMRRVKEGVTVVGVPAEKFM